MSSKKATKSKLTLPQEQFCKNFVSADFFGNGVQSYIDAYKPDQSKPNWYNRAKSNAAELLTKPDLLNRINELLDLSGFNDANVDKQLLVLIQQNADFNAKVAAIREYNKLKMRITERLDVNVKNTVYNVGYKKPEDD